MAQKAKGQAPILPLEIANVAVLGTFILGTFARNRRSFVRGRSRSRGRRCGAIDDDLVGGLLLLAGLVARGRRVLSSRASHGSGTQVVDLRT